jgi:hypothetical protein
MRVEFDLAVTLHGAPCVIAAPFSRTTLMRKSNALLALAAFVGIALLSDRVRADFIPPSPASLAAAGGTQYEILFVTSGMTEARSSSISTYNAFAQAQASTDLSLPTTTWNAVASTPSTNANSNAPSVAGIPVFDTQGNLITNAGLYAGSLTNPPQYDENGNLDQTLVWTGSASTGLAVQNFELGSPLTVTQLGLSSSAASTWLEYGAHAYDVGNSIYALSSPIDDPSFTPEPASLTLLVSGCLAFAGVRLRRRRRTATEPLRTN